MPVLPDWLKQRLLPKHIVLLPGFVIRPMAMLSDVITGFMLQNPEFKAYALHNLYHIRKFVFSKLGIKASAATRVIEDVKFEQPPVAANVHKVA